ncbi:phage major tropism determinant [Desulfoplanes formicivorans]|uniref:Major tropism determinant second domain-containing protein n=1 Tax=Desulfoplanes formicivorans TaxID=1592317 RepID=A0A194AFP2_9BACT|nr:hypothetical protein [Desulfoplanes formicivorans]GAU08148.1 hypothetical protein DPF_0851 [Desulfoplanes formicivorans]
MRRQWRNEDSAETKILAETLSLAQTLRGMQGVPILTVNDDGDGVVINAETVVPMISGDAHTSFVLEEGLEIKDLDIGSLTLGQNYGVYVCDDGSKYGEAVISANTTAPDGYTATNSIKIGGFHYGRVRTYDQRFDKTATLDVQVVPNSVWDLICRPACLDPAGMAKVGGVWVDIYLNSEDGTQWPETIPQSVYGAVPLTGTEGYSYFDYAQLAANAGKRLPTYQEFLAYAYGVPAGNTGASGRVNTGSQDWMVSCANIDQPSGNVYQLTGNLGFGGGSSWASHDEGVDSAYDHGDLYGSVYQLRVGGDWGDPAGARCALAYSTVWNVDGNVGLRCVSDPL